MINASNFCSKDFNNANTEIIAKLKKINKRKIFYDLKREFIKISQNSDYDNILRMFNLKNAIIPKSKILELTGIKNQDEYVNLIVMLLKKGDRVSRKITREISKKILKTLNN